MRGIIGIGLLGMSLLTGCVFWGDAYRKKEVTSFAVDKQENPNLTVPIPGRIDQQARTIVLRFPNTVPRQMVVPRFQYTGLRATLDGAPIESGSRAMDFTKNHTIEITGVDDSVQSYTIQSAVQAKVFHWFRFSSPVNPLLNGDVLGVLDSPTNWNIGWWSREYGWIEDFFAPTKSIQIDLPANPPPSLVPNFSHNALEVRWNGQPLVPGVTAIDATSDQVLTLVGIDGSTQDVALQFVFPALALASFELLVEDNPTLRKDYVGNVDWGTKVISVAVPQYVDATTLVARFSHNGTKLLINGLEAISGTTKADLSHSGTLTLMGSGGKTQDFQLLVTSVAPSSSKQILSRNLYGSVRQTPPFVPNYYDRINYVTETSPATDVYTVTTYNSYYSKPIDPSLVYLEFQTTAIQVSAGAQTLTPGLLAEGVYSPANWLDFSKPVVLTLTSEDLSTKTVTLSLVVK